MSKKKKNGKTNLDPLRVILEPVCEKCGWQGSDPCVKGAVCPNKLEVKDPEGRMVVKKCGAKVGGKSVSRDAFLRARAKVETEAGAGAEG